jgi:hypothetical protein
MVVGEPAAPAAHCNPGVHCNLMGYKFASGIWGRKNGLGVGSDGRIVTCTALGQPVKHSQQDFGIGQAASPG